MRRSGPLIAVLLCTFLVPAAAREVTIPLEIADGEGCRFDARGAQLLARVPTPNDDGLIAIEAEETVRHQFDPNVRHANTSMPQDPDSSAGRYLDHAVYASYQFIARQPGDYWLWVRVRTGEGRWRFRDVVNGTVWWFFDEPERNEPPDEPDRWHWAKRRKVTLGEGFNRLVVTDYGYDFPQVDRFVFAPSEDWRPEGMGPEVIADMATGGWVETSPLTIPGLQRLVRLEGLPGQTAEVSARTEESEQWQRVHHGLVSSGQVRLDGTAPAGDGLQFRIWLSGVSSMMREGSLAAVAEVDESRYVELHSGRTRLVLDGETAGLFLVQDAESGEAIAMPGRPQPLISVDFKRAGQRRKVRVDPEGVTELIAEHDERRGWLWQEQEPQPAITEPRSVKVGDNSLSATWMFAIEGMGRAEVGYAIEPDDAGGFRMEARVRPLEGPADVVAVTFPRIEHCRLGRSGLDDVQFRMQSFGHEAVNPGSGPIRDASYLGSVVMPWQEVYDRDLGLYVGAHDPQAYNCQFVSEAGGLAAEHFSFALRKLDDISPGAERTYPFELAVHGGGWHSGADRYRRWFRETFGRAEYPDWMRTFDGWLDLQAENMRRRFRFSHLPDILTRARAIGLDWTQVWGQFSYDGGPCCHDFGALSPLYGGRQGWAEAAHEIVSRGGHIGGYFVYDRLDRLPILTDWFLGHFRKSQYPEDTPWVTADFFTDMMVITDPGGELPAWPPPQDELDERLAAIEEHQELYESWERARPVIWWEKVWVNDPQWWEYLRSWIVDLYAREYGCNACYIDVLGCGGAMESYDPRRGHNGEGSWGLGRLNIAREVVEGAREVFPDYAPSMEGMGDLPGLYCASMCSGVYRGARNVMRYTFPDRIFIHGLANSGSGGSSIDRYCETFLEGMRYDFVGMPAADGLRFLRLQRSFTAWLYDARFMDTRGLTVTDPRVKVRRHDLADGPVRGCLLTIVNREGLEQQGVTCDESALGGVSHAFYATIDGKVGPLELSRLRGRFDSLVRFEPPGALASQVLLVSRAEDAAAVWPILRLVRHGEPHVAVTLLNLSAQSQSGTCRVANLSFPEPREDEIQAAREQLPLTRSEAQFDLEPREAGTLRFPVESLRRHYYTVRLQATIQREGKPPIQREFLALPIMLDGSFEALGTDSDLAVHGRRVLELGPSMEGYQYAPQRLWVEPGHRYRLQVRSRRTGFDARVHSTALQVRGESFEGPIERAAVDTDRVDEWQTLEYEFETPDDLTRATLYLYNVESPDTAWFDDVYVEDLGPAVQ
ncbi:MAG: hypothetical protein U9R79_15765 [Armatimonadota bacterium]|nr:hypothetical protein [Armatimonadota bacterium]